MDRKSQFDHDLRQNLSLSRFNCLSLELTSLLRVKLDYLDSEDSYFINWHFRSDFVQKKMKGSVDKKLQWGRADLSPLQRCPGLTPPSINRVSGDQSPTVGLNPLNSV